MHQLLATQLDQMLSEASCPNGLSCAAPLRAAAATVSRADPDEIPATTVIGVLGADDLPAFRALVADIAKEFGVEASIRLHVGSFSVRFAHHPDSATETHSHARPNWVLAWIAQLWRHAL